MISKRILSIAVGGALVLSGWSSAAFAVSVTTTGAKTTTTSVTSTAWNVTSHDTLRDNRFTSAPWLGSNGVSGSVVNKKGDLTSKTEMVVGNKTVRLSKVKACRSNPYTPMSCSDWVKTGY